MDTSVLMESMLGLSSPSSQRRTVETERPTRSATHAWSLRAASRASRISRPKLFRGTARFSAQRRSRRYTPSSPSAENSAAEGLTAVYGAVYIPCVGKHASSRVVPIRLPHDLADLVDEQAEAEGTSRNEFLVRRIKGSFRQLSANRKTVTKTAEGEDLLEPLPEEEAS